MRFIIVTGMSGAGKSTALKMLEDFGYYCVDNLPIPLIQKFVELTAAAPSSISNVALGIDVRNREMLEPLRNVLKELDLCNVKYEILYLDASDECLVKRYKETRRSHPLSLHGRVEDGINQEREMMFFLRKKADYVINTTQLLTRELKAQLEDIFVNGESYNSLYITVLSFGFKYGIPADADLVFDVRFLPNPYYFEDMRPLTGNDAKVHDYVMQFETAVEFMQKLSDLIYFLIPHYISEGKSQLVIAIGCTGGKHRSVTIANELYKTLESHEDECGIKLDHRDIDKDAKRR